MKAKLPIKNFENNEITEKEFDVDFTLLSQMRFESKFPELAKHEDLLSYSKRIMNYDLNMAKLLSMLKTLYCWFDTDIEFLDFVKLFDFSDKNYVDLLISKIKSIFDLILNSSVEKN